MIYKIEKNIHTHGIEIAIRNEKDELIYNVNEGIYFNKKILSFFDINKNKTIYIEEENNMNLHTYNIYINEVLVGSLNYNILFFKYNFDINKNNIQFQIEGDCSSMEFTIFKDESKVAEVSKRSIILSEAYEIDILSREDEKFLLAVIITIDYLLYDIGNANRY